MYDIHLYIVGFTHSCDRLGSNRHLLNQPKISKIGSRFSLIFPGGYIRRLSFLVSRQRTLWLWIGGIVAHLFANPMFANSIETTPYQLFDGEENIRAYSEFMSAEFAWEYHVRFSPLISKI